jgi:hypothetical protein
MTQIQETSIYIKIRNNHSIINVIFSFNVELIMKLLFQVRIK